MAVLLLPSDVWIQILSLHAEPRDFFSFEQVCRRFREVAKSAPALSDYLAALILHKRVSCLRLGRHFGDSRPESLVELTNALVKADRAWSTLHLRREGPELHLPHIRLYDWVEGIPKDTPSCRHVSWHTAAFLSPNTVILFRNDTEPAFELWRFTDAAHSMHKVAELQVEIPPHYYRSSFLSNMSGQGSSMHRSVRDRRPIHPLLPEEELVVFQIEGKGEFVQLIVASRRTLLGYANGCSSLNDDVAPIPWSEWTPGRVQRIEASYYNHILIMGQRILVLPYSKDAYGVSTPESAKLEVQGAFRLYDFGPASVSQRPGPRITDHDLARLESHIVDGLPFRLCTGDCDAFKTPLPTPQQNFHLNDLRSDGSNLLVFFARKDESYRVHDYEDDPPRLKVFLYEPNLDSEA